MASTKDHRTAQEKWEQLMAEARSKGRPWLFEHRRPLPQHRETWHHSKNANRVYFPEKSSAILRRGQIPHGFRDDTEDELTTKVTVLRPLFTISPNDNDDDQTETRTAKVVKVIRENPRQTAQKYQISMKPSLARECPIEVLAGPSWKEWCAWDEEYLWARFAVQGLQYERLAPFGQSCPFMDLGYENVKLTMIQQHRGTQLHNPAAQRLILQQRFWNLADRRARRPLPRNWRMVQKEQFYEHQDRGFIYFFQSADPTTVVPSEKWMDFLIEYISLQKAQDVHCLNFLAEGMYDCEGQPCPLSDWQQRLQQETNHGARKIRALWSESILLTECAARRPSTPPLKMDKDGHEEQEHLPGQHRELFDRQNTTYGHDRWPQKVTESRVASPHLTPSFTEGRLTADDRLKIPKNPLGSIGSNRRRQEAPRGYRHY